MNKKIMFTFCTGLLLIISSCNQPSKTKTLFLAHGLPKSHPVHKGIVHFQDELTKISKGKLTIKIFSDGQLGNERETLELLQIGSIALTKVSAAVMANFSPEYEVLGVPYLFRDKKHLFDVLEGDLGNQILEGSNDHLLKGLCFYDAGSRSFYTKTKAIRKPEDLIGLKLRVMNHQMSIDMVNRFGGSATPMSFGELYTALQQGVVDGAENNPPSLVASNHYEVCKYYTLDEHSSIPDVMVIGSKFWKKLNDEERSWVVEAARKSVIAQKQYWAESVKECFELLKKNGVEVIHPNKSLFHEKCKILVEEFSKDIQMKKLVDRIKTY